MALGWAPGGMVERTAPAPAAAAGEAWTGAMAGMDRIIWDTTKGWLVCVMVDSFLLLVDIITNHLRGVIIKCPRSNTKIPIFSGNKTSREAVAVGSPAVSAAVLTITLLTLLSISSRSIHNSNNYYNSNNSNNSSSNNSNNTAMERARSSNSFKVLPRWPSEPPLFREAAVKLEGKKYRRSFLEIWMT